MKFEFIMTIIIAIVCNILLAVIFYSVQEVPYWTKYILGAGFNVAVGMVIMNYMYMVVANE